MKKVKGYSKRVALYFLAKKIVIFSQVFIVSQKSRGVGVKYEYLSNPA
jgi:hypothetical protein